MKPMATWTEEQREKVREKERRRWANWPIEKKKAHTAKYKSWYQANPEKARRQSYNRNIAMRYGLSRADYDRMLDKQNRLCALCGRPHEEISRKGLDVDHDHSSGAVRSLLCRSCNTLVGYIETHRGRIDKVLAYLDTHRSSQEDNPPA